MAVRASAEQGKAVSQEEIVALLASEGHSQAKIGAFLKMSQPTVSRLLTAAESRHVLVRKVTLRLPEPRIRMIRAHLGELKKWEDLKARLKALCAKGRLAEVEIVPLLDTDPDARSDPWEAKCLEFGKRASRLVVEYLERAESVGVSYGRTLASVVIGLEGQAEIPAGERRDVRFFPTWTEPYEDADYKFRSALFPNPADVSSTRLARAFTRLLSAGDTIDVPALNCFPSLLPLDDKKFGPAALAIIRDFYDSIASYHRVFEKGTGLIHRMDTALVGIGTTKPQGPKANPNWHVSKTMVESAGFAPAQHELAYLGDIGGVWLPNPKADAKAKVYIERIRDRWMGVTFDHLDKCAAVAKENNRVGVIALAVGAERAEATIESIRAGLVNRLIIDSSLAKALDKMTKGT